MASKRKELRPEEYIVSACSHMQLCGDVFGRCDRDIRESG